LLLPVFAVVIPAQRFGGIDRTVNVVAPVILLLSFWTNNQQHQLLQFKEAGGK